MTPPACHAVRSEVAAIDGAATGQTVVSPCSENPAEAVNRLNISSENESVGLPELIDSLSSSGAKSKTKGVLEGATETLLGSDDEDEDNEKQRTRRRRS